MTESGLRRAAAALIVLLAASGGALAVSGVPLMWSYEPGRPGGFGTLLQDVHTVASTLFLGSAAALLIVLATAVVRRWPSPWPGWLPALGVLVVTVVAVQSGARVAWDGIGYRPVGVHGQVRGVFAPLDGDVRFVLVTGRADEVSPGAYAAWLLTHLLVVPLAALAVVWATRRWRPAPASSEPGADRDVDRDEATGDGGPASRPG